MTGNFQYYVILLTRKSTHKILFRNKNTNFDFVFEFFSIRALGIKIYVRRKVFASLKIYERDTRCINKKKISVLN